jgi:hypothetical protein
LQEDLAVAQTTLGQAPTSALTDLLADALTEPEDRRLVFDRALENVAVRRGPGALADRVEITPRV